VTDINVFRGKMPSFCDVAARLQFPTTRSYPVPDKRSPLHFTLFLYFISYKIRLVCYILAEFLDRIMFVFPSPFLPKIELL